MHRRPTRGKVLEGFVDLIYREDDGSLVIVDDKTDDAPEPFSVVSRTGRARRTAGLGARMW